jgi:hypothetical protein
MRVCRAHAVGENLPADVVRTALLAASKEECCLRAGDSRLYSAERVANASDANTTFGYDANATSRFLAADFPVYECAFYTAPGGLDAGTLPFVSSSAGRDYTLHVLGGEMSLHHPWRNEICESSDGVAPPDFSLCSGSLYKASVGTVLFTAAYYDIRDCFAACSNTPDCLAVAVDYTEQPPTVQCTGLSSVQAGDAVGQLHVRSPQPCPVPSTPPCEADAVVITVVACAGLVAATAIYIKISASRWAEPNPKDVLGL